MLYKISELETKLGYVFKDKNLLLEALTHPSKKLEDKNVKTFQRLEFLGDKALNFIIAYELFERFPNENEGQISQRHSHLACGTACFEIAKQMDILPHVILSKAQVKDKTYNETKVGEDVLEAIIGAIFLDSGIEFAKKFVLENWSSLFLGHVAPPKDAKSAVQEYFQRQFKSLPQYSYTQSGLAHEPIFTASLNVVGKMFSAQATTKKEAEKICSQQVMDFLNQQ